MVNYGFKVGLDTPNLIDIAQKAKERDELQARKNYEDRIKLMQMLGRGVGAYMMNRDYNDWKQDQANWADEGAMLDLIGAGYYDPEDLDISMLENSIINDAYNNAVPNAANDWRDTGI